MKYKVIFLAGLNGDELKSLDDALVPLHPENRKDFFSRLVNEDLNIRAVLQHIPDGRLQMCGRRDAEGALAEHPEKYVKALPQFEVKIVAKLKLPFPEEIEENGQRYRLVLE